MGSKYKYLYKKLPELETLEILIEKLQQVAEINVLTKIHLHHREFPLYSLKMGCNDPEAPVLGFFAGVHGLERIGTEVVLAYMQTLSGLVEWDHLIQESLEKVKILFVPLVNPAGMYLGRRSNANGVDLMRNAPHDAETTPNVLLLGGHRISSKLPWFRGHDGDQMEDEAYAVCDFVRREMFSSKRALSLDVHSGFGAIDRLWFPYAKTQSPFPNLAEMYALNKLMDQTLPNHVYCMEPQATQYTTHGDLWDYLYDKHRETQADNFYVPLTLEMGSWIWVKKNPRQAFSHLGRFNPVKDHRRKRILRRHLPLFDFLLRALISNEEWVDMGDRTKEYELAATERWFC